MNHEEFAARAEAVLGAGWQGRAARAFSCNATTVYRWATGASSIPGTVAATIEFLEATPEAFWPARWLEPAGSRRNAA